MARDAWPGSDGGAQAITAQQSTAVEARRTDRWRWLYWLSVALFLSAAAMPYVVAWLWERGLIVRDRPWEYYGLENIYLRQFLLSLLFLTIYRFMTKKYFCLVFFLLSFYLMEVKKGSTNDLDYKELFTVMGVGFVYISFLLSFIDRLFFINMPREWLVYLWRGFLIIMLIVVYMFLGGYVYNPVYGWYYFPGSGYLSLYDNLKKYRYEFLHKINLSVERNIKEYKEIPEGLLPKSFLCQVEKLYDNVIRCAISDLSCFKKRHNIHKDGNVKLDIYFDIEGFGPYVSIYYRRNRVYDGRFYGYFPSTRLQEYEDKYVTYCKEGGVGKSKKEADLER